MIIVSDTSGLFYLSQVGFVHLLPELFKEVYVPNAVYKELLEVNNVSSIHKLLQEPWLQIIEVKDVYLISHLEIYLDKGESEAIALALQMRADYLFIDERKGRERAEAYQLKIIGLLGILLLAKQNNLINAIAPIISKLVNETNFRCSSTLIKSILLQANEI